MKTRWRWKVLTIEDLKKKKCLKIISEKNAPRRLMSCDISSELWLYVCAFIALGREVTLCDLTHRSHKLCQSSPKNQPGNLWVESCQFLLFLKSFHEMEKEVEKKPLCQFQSLIKPNHHGNAAATDEGPGVQGDRRRQRRV